jgi:hypothetical protein
MESFVVENNAAEKCRIDCEDGDVVLPEQSGREVQSRP